MTSNTLPSAAAEVSRIIEMAWEDRTPFEAIQVQYGLNEQDVICLMRSHLSRGSFKAWRQRVSGRSTKHQELRPEGVMRAYCPTQYKHK
ncbi:TIGR03643 family protein [Marinicella sediminis]|uniref:TIGR03643 family protein n=1 Tax=Marinicella sediminis TaxID=1792834 RepID=A0ABV7JBS3_9GAMM|nr:TIGR03643 family protein [Marinicella sediminis]